MNVKIANQNTGVMSTPKAGGICPFTSLNNGSDGHATTAHGNSLRFVSGYQDATTRHSCFSMEQAQKQPTRKNQSKLSSLFQRGKKQKDELEKNQFLSL
jgi:hypothetical protein